MESLTKLSIEICLNIQRVMLSVEICLNIQRVIQMNTLEDRSVHDKQQWDSAVKFMELAVGEKLKQSQSSVEFRFGND